VTGVKRINSGTGHRYTVDGKPAVGVTTALRALPKPALMYWSAKSVAEFVADNIQDLIVRMDAAGGRDPLVAYLKAIPWQRRDTAAIKGTDVHRIAEKIHAGEPFDVPEHLTGYVEQYLRFLEDENPTPLHTEFVIANRDPLYCGTGDSIMSFPARGVGLCDIKTGSGVYGEAAYQLAAYRFAESLVADGVERPMPGVDFCAVIHVREDGYDLVPVVADEQAFEAFKHAHWLYSNELKQDWRSRRSPMDDRILPAFGIPVLDG
jgi:hypothetical protein